MRAFLASGWEENIKIFFRSYYGKILTGFQCKQKFHKQILRRPTFDKRNSTFIAPIANEKTDAN